MPISKQEQEFVSYLVDLLQCVGPTIAKRMFGGHGLFIEGLMFGLIADGILYLKANEESRQEFIDKGLPAFTYLKKDKLCSLSYFQVPEESMDDPKIMEYWGNLGFRAALQEATKKAKKATNKHVSKKV